MKTTATIGWLPLQGGRVAVFPLERGSANSPPHPIFRCKGVVILGLALAAWAVVALPVWYIIG